VKLLDAFWGAVTAQGSTVEFGMHRGCTKLMKYDDENMTLAEE